MTRLGEPDPVRRREPAGLEAHPLALRMAKGVDADLGIDRGRGDERERVADSAAEVGGGRDPFERRDRLTRHDRALQPEPRGRRPRDAEPAAHEPDVVCRPVADVLAVEELDGRRRTFGDGRRRGNRRRHGVGDVDCLRTHPQGGRARDLYTVRQQHTFQPLHLLAGSDRARHGLQRGDRHRTQQFHGEPGDERRGTGIMPGQDVREQRARRATVQRVRRPRPAPEWRRDEPLTVAHEQRSEFGDRIGGHAASYADARDISSVTR